MQIQRTVLAILTSTVFATACRERAGPPDSGLATPDSVRIAVLPFATVGDSGGRYFGLGLAAEVERMLDSVEHVTVQPWNQEQNSVTWKDVPSSDDDSGLARLGHRLGVTHVLGGSVRRDGARTGMALKLIRVRDGLALWSGMYWRETSGLHVLPEDLTADVAEALRTAPKVKR
jgi:TolB-like protein